MGSAVKGLAGLPINTINTPTEPEHSSSRSLAHICLLNPAGLPSFAGRQLAVLAQRLAEGDPQGSPHWYPRRIPEPGWRKKRRRHPAAPPPPGRGL